jgi:hypothetical protein
MKTMLMLMLMAAACLLAGCAPAEYSPTSVRGAEADVANGAWARVEYNGHVYIRWNGHYAGGIVHDPDCPCGSAR